MSDPDDLRPDLVEVGRYRRVAEARERGLVAAARDVPHWVVRDGDEWVLKVEASVAEFIGAELRAFERDEQARPSPRFIDPLPRLDLLPLLVAAATLIVIFLVADEPWMDRGAALSEAIMQRGEWWRLATALTLHGDFAHLAANLASGALFTVFALPYFGRGLTWLLIILGGMAGNALNAWGYRTESHASIGASTAVFAALGLLIGAEFFARLRAPQTRSRWQLVLPLGAGLALLAFLGVGEEQSHVDYMAHFWGFAVGGPLGFGAAALRLKERLPAWLHGVLAAAAMALLAAAWWFAWRGN